MFEVPAFGTPGVERVAAIELITPIGGMIRYALLGGRFVPDDSSVLRVNIGVSGDSVEGERFSTSLPVGVDVIRVGLPGPYVKGVFEGMTAAFESTAPPSGSIFIDCAAHGSVGSSVVAFRDVARSLARLFGSTSAKLDDKSVAEAL
jgi:hypothetical protein